MPINYADRTNLERGKITGGRPGSLYGVWGSSAPDVFAVGRDSTILHYDGSVWSKVSNVGTWGWHFDDVWCKSASDVFFVGWGPW